MTAGRNSDKICIIPWIHVSTTTKGSMRLCCHSRESFYKDERGRTMKLYRNQLPDVFQSELNISVRKQMLKGEIPDSCRACFESEAISNSSPRLDFNERFRHLRDLVDKNDPQAVFLDLRLGNKCNLKCQMCDSQNSSRHMADSGDDQLMRQMEWTENKVYLEKMNAGLEQIEEVYFAGGEPLLIEDHYELLKRLIASNRAPHVTLHYNTNGTVFSEELAELWRNFKKIRIGVSIDGHGDLNESIRAGSKWASVNKNLDRFSELADEVTVNTCVMNSNVESLPDLFEYCFSKPLSVRFPYLSIVRGMPHLALEALDPSTKRRIFEKLNVWLKSNEARYLKDEGTFLNRLHLVLHRLR